MVKKSLLAAAMSAAMLLTANQALAAAYEPGTDVDAATANAQSASSFRAMPCLSKPESSTMDNYNYSPCGNMMYQLNPASMHLKAALGMWFGLVFIITVVMAWVIMLLVIVLLWKLIKKHKHS